MSLKTSILKALPYILRPLSWLYGIVTEVRNWMFDHNVLPAEEFDVNVISVGNLTVGGTGKTPHVEFIAGHLSSVYNTAVLSRGYKRKTRGFVLANANSTPETIGDEPLQIYRKLGPEVRVAVCENRRKGIREIMRQFPDTQLIVLDDAFQHRYVKPKVNILLTDYSRPVFEDKLLPLGRLRESMHQMHRADMVIVTKCPADLPPLEYRMLTNKLDLMAFQNPYFSTFRYGRLAPVFPKDKPYRIEVEDLTAQDTVLLVTGIANPRGFIRHFGKYPFKRVIAHFPDHHDFTRDDLKALQGKFQSLPGKRKVIITTEKDAVRLAYNPYFPARLKSSVYFMPVTVEMLPGIENRDLISDLISDLDKKQ